MRLFFETKIDLLCRSDYKLFLVFSTAESSVFTCITLFEDHQKCLIFKHRKKGFCFDKSQLLNGANFGKSKQT